MGLPRFELPQLLKAVTGRTQIGTINAAPRANDTKLHYSPDIKQVSTFLFKDF